MAAALASSHKQPVVGPSPHSSSSPKDANLLLDLVDKDKSNNTNRPAADTSAAAEKTSAPSNTDASGSDKKITAATNTSSSTNAPLAPPPRPSQSGPPNSSDYFGAGHNKAHFSLEPNPFEQSFGQPSSEDRKTFSHPLPSVSSLTSPAPLGPGATPDWQNSLRVGPLSPAMLTGPTGSNGGDYFDSTFRQSFPTPNESSMRSTGLTPGGPSMFPAPSPNSQAIFNSIQNGGATPGTLDFHRTAMNAKARTMSDQSVAPAGNMQPINKSEYQPAQQQQSIAQNPFNNNSESDAVNSLYMLANNGQRNPNQFSMQPSQNQTQGVPHGQNSSAAMRAGQDQQQAAGHRGNNQPAGGMSGNGGAGGVEGYGSDASLDTKTAGGNKNGGKKGAKAAGNARRKQDDPPSAGKGPANKKTKGNSGAAVNIDGPDDMDDDDDDDPANDVGPNGKKLTDEEKRKNFLERNRVAALKCRQRKKQWLANLQAKVEIFTSENDALTNQCASLREENQNLKALLIQHKDCPVSHSQGISGNRLLGLLGIPDNFAENPYAMNMRDNIGQVGR